jgi:hypothetical protein
LRRDVRFTVDDVPLDALVAAALAIGWTTEPFDRLVSIQG